MQDADLPMVQTYHWLLEALIRKSEGFHAWSLLLEMLEEGVEPGNQAYCDILDIFILQKDIPHGYLLLSLMVENCIKSDRFGSFIAACLEMNELQCALQSLDLWFEAGFEPDQISYNRLIHACIQENEVARAYALFKQMHNTDVTLDSATCASLIHALIQINNLPRALSIFQKMKAANVPLNLDSKALNLLWQLQSQLTKL